MGRPKRGTAQGFVARVGTSVKGIEDSIEKFRFENAAYIGLTFPSRTVRLVENAKNRSPRLPTSCDACHETIGEYPFIAKHHKSYRKYHVSCALRIAIVLPSSKF